MSEATKTALQDAIIAHVKDELPEAVDPIITGWYVRVDAHTGDYPLIIKASTYQNDTTAEVIR